jgi:hypothetical protein
MLVASKLTFGPDIGPRMVRAVADVPASRWYLLLAKRCRETPAADGGVTMSYIRLIATMYIWPFMMRCARRLGIAPRRLQIQPARASTVSLVQASTITIRVTASR